jgi:DHA1 family bicyclomycin/chloramphenicol resistance-like MFS transporter
MIKEHGISRRRLTLILGALAMFGPFAIDTLFPAFPDVARDFGVSSFAMQQTISAYLIAYALMSVIQGPLSDAHGRKPVLLMGTGLFALASVGCALSTSLDQLLVFRALQGMSAGVGLIVGRAIVRDCFDGDAAQRLLSGVTMTFSIAPAIAPIIGGWIIAWLPWPAIFWFLTGFSVLLLVATALWLPETHPAAQRQPFRPGSLWANNRRMLANREFVKLAFAGGFNFAALFLYIASAPAFVLDILKLNAQQFGWFFVPTIAGMSLGAFISGHLAGRLSGPQAIRLGFAVCAISAVFNLGYNLAVDVPQLPWAVLPMAVNALGIAIVFPILTLALLDMYPRQRGAVSSLQAVIGLSVNATVAGLISPWVSGSPLALACVAALSTLVAWLIWRRHAGHGPPPALPGADEAVALEPSDRL